MACYTPLRARRQDAGGRLIISPKDGNWDTLLPCGKCLGCRTANQLQWTHRSIHEARLWQHNRFITLTYDDEHVPEELRPEHVQKFLKRLRRRATDDNILTNLSHSIRYLLSGEYGDRTERPHYHISGFNIGFKDEQPLAETKNGTLYTSKTLTDIWGQGAAKLTPFTPATAGYVAGYITKSGNKKYYTDDGREKHPPFRRASTKPAIGRTWLEKYPDDVQHGYMIIENQKVPLPRYYTERQKITHEHRTDNRLAERRPKTDRNNPERLKAALAIHEQNLARKTRKL